MTTVLNRGGRAKEEAARSAAVYEAVLTELGATGTIVPLGDPIYRTGGTTFRSVSGVSGLETAVWTASEAPESFDTAPTRQGICPVVNFNGTDEYLTAPDAGYWTRDDSGAAPVSMGGWVYLTDDSSSRTLLSKYDNGNGREWLLYVTGSDFLQFLVRDESASASSDRTTDAAVPLGRWVFLVVTYDGTGGTAPLGGTNCVIYVDGVAFASTNNNSNTYVAMEDGTGTVSVGSNQGGGSSARQHYFDGKIAGGPAGPIFTQIELTAEQVMNIYRLQKGALAL